MSFQRGRTSPPASHHAAILLNNKARTRQQGRKPKSVKFADFIHHSILIEVEELCTV
jgi:hypothetical protein